jgi:transposase InsO family protein
MATALDVHGAFCVAVIHVLLRLAVAVDEYERRVERAARRLRGSVRKLRQRWLAERGLLAPKDFARHRRAWNRTAAHVEEQVVRLHVEQPQLGSGQLMRLAERILGLKATRETVRRILARRAELVVQLSEERRRRRRRIHVAGRLELWGMDLTLVWVLGVFPVWLVGIVDYHGSRLMVLERVAWPRAAPVTSVLLQAIAVHGAPARVLTDNGPCFVSGLFGKALARSGIKHCRTRPAHPWTNGRIERVFGTFKQTVRGCLWLFVSVSQVDRFCHDFLRWHNRDRPHSAWAGRTPDEVWFGKKKRLRPLGRVDYFEGALHWWRFG